MPELPSKEVVAVIDIGSSAIRLVIAEIGPKQSIRYLENLQKSITFGKDVFTTGRLSAPVVRDAIVILKNYRALCDQYGVKRIQTVGTSAVREAANRDNFIDQVYVRTGFDVEILEGPEENRLELIAVEHALQNRYDFENKNALIIEVGSGSTEVILTVKGQVAVTRTLSVGGIRLPEQASADMDHAHLQRVVRRYTQTVSRDLAKEVNLTDINLFIALGGHIRFLSKQMQAESNDLIAILETKRFLEFVRSLSKMSTEDIVDTYNLPYDDAETLYPSLLLYTGFLSETKAELLVVPLVSIRDGLLWETAQLISGSRRTDLSRQVLHSAKRLGKKYQYDEAHAMNVTHNALQLFDALKEDHGLGPRERLLLEVAGLVHDIGGFISPNSHHKHGSYLIDAAEIFGLRKADKDIVSQVVRYHRKSPPKPNHVPYMSLPRNDRATVSKLASLLRVAEALDKSHQQRIKQISVERKDGSYILWVPTDVGDLTLEREALSGKVSMFADVLGGPLLMKQGTPPLAVKA